MCTLAAGLLVFSAGCACSRTADDSTLRSANVALVERYISAWNRHEVELLLSFVHDDVEWLSVVGSELRLETRGVQALKAALNAAFARGPSTRSTIESVMAAGRFISVRERAHWQGASGPHSQSALAIYEIENGRIRRVWYYPAQSQAPAPGSDPAPHMQ